ncbi:MAG: DNA-protecting protein DprA, partial [Actinomycetales bacterium]
PRGHASLLDRIVGTGGLVVSEQAPGAEPLRSRFLSRNRVIAALAEGTLVVEAARRSGSLNTLHWADRLGRITMGLPGPVTSAQSDGVHQAVRDGKAVLVGSSRHVMVELGVRLTDDPDAPDPDSAYDRLPLMVRRALDALSWGATASVEDVAGRAGLTTDEALAAVTVLHGRGLVSCLDGRWLLTGRADSA